jgi:hypothetical protein
MSADLSSQLSDDNDCMLMESMVVMSILLIGYSFRRNLAIIGAFMNHVSDSISIIKYSK